MARLLHGWSPPLASVAVPFAEDGTPLLACRTLSGHSVEDDDTSEDEVRTLSRTGSFRSVRECPEDSAYRRAEFERAESDSGFLIAERQESITPPPPPTSSGTGLPAEEAAALPAYLLWQLRDAEYEVYCEEKEHRRVSQQRRMKVTSPDPTRLSPPCRRVSLEGVGALWGGGLLDGSANTLTSAAGGGAPPPRTESPLHDWAGLGMLEAESAPASRGGTPPPPMLPAAAVPAPGAGGGGAVPLYRRRSSASLLPAPRHLRTFSAESFGSLSEAGSLQLSSSLRRRGPPSPPPPVVGGDVPDFLVRQMREAEQQEWEAEQQALLATATKGLRKKKAWGAMLDNLSVAAIQDASIAPSPTAESIDGFSGLGSRQGTSGASASIVLRFEGSTSKLAGSVVPGAAATPQESAATPDLDATIDSYFTPGHDLVPGSPALPQIVIETQLNRKDLMNIQEYCAGRADVDRPIGRSSPQVTTWGGGHANPFHANTYAPYAPRITSPELHFCDSGAYGSFWASSGLRQRLTSPLLRQQCDEGVGFATGEVDSPGSLQGNASFDGVPGEVGGCDAAMPPIYTQADAARAPPTNDIPQSTTPAATPTDEHLNGAASPCTVPMTSPKTSPGNTAVRADSTARGGCAGGKGDADPRPDEARGEGVDLLPLPCRPASLRCGARAPQEELAAAWPQTSSADNDTPEGVGCSRALFAVPDSPPLMVRGTDSSPPTTPTTLPSQRGSFAIDELFMAAGREMGLAMCMPLNAMGAADDPALSDPFPTTAWAGGDDSVFVSAVSNTSATGARVELNADADAGVDADMDVMDDPSAAAEDAAQVTVYMPTLCYPRAVSVPSVGSGDEHASGPTGFRRASTGLHARPLRSVYHSAMTHPLPSRAGSLRRCRDSGSGASRSSMATARRSASQRSQRASLTRTLSSLSDAVVIDTLWDLRAQQDRSLTPHELSAGWLQSGCDAGTAALTAPQKAAMLHSSFGAATNTTAATTLTNTSGEGSLLEFNDSDVLSDDDPGPPHTDAARILPRARARSQSGSAGGGGYKRHVSPCPPLHHRHVLPTADGRRRAEGRAIARAAGREAAAALYRAVAAHPHKARARHLTPPPERPRGSSYLLQNVRAPLLTNSRC